MRAESFYCACARITSSQLRHEHPVPAADKKALQLSLALSLSLSTSRQSLRRASYAATMPVTELKTKTEFDKALKDLPAGTLMVVDFTATWCGPCRMIKPKFEEMSNEFTDVRFYKVRG